MNAIARIEEWFARYDSVPFDYQREVWRHYGDGRSGLIHAPTGYGKTYAAWLGPIIRHLQEGPEDAPQPLRVLWITPLRALANDTAESLRRPITDMRLPWTVEIRTGDTKAADKNRIRRKPPSALITTPESLSLLLSYPDSKAIFRDIECVVVDEWHELIGSKRGVQAELGIARLRTIAPGLRVWGLSATLGNTNEAMRVLLGPDASDDGVLVRGAHEKHVEITTVIPANMEHFPWGGHLGTKLLPQVIPAIEASRSTLLFTNTRSQAELWHQAFVAAKPEWEHQVALHHGSLDRVLRAAYEEGLRQGKLRCVVCTSSLDLGVDFSPVDQVIQVGSPKGVARLMQRAGRSGHSPDGISHILCVPTHSFELMEFAAAREAVQARAIENREPVEKPLDVLTQHLVTIALGSGFRTEKMLAELRTTYAFRNLADEEWEWALDFITRGGQALRAYDSFARVVADADGVYRVRSRQIARNHRMAIGTITSDSHVRIKFANGGTIGQVEESFIARLQPGDRFIFGGRALEFVRLRDMTATVRKASGPSRVVPKWMGGRMPLSSQLARAVRDKLEEARTGSFEGDEMRALETIFAIQAEWSRIPAPDELLVERISTRDGDHHFLYPYGGRLVHEGLAPLLALRLNRIEPRSFSLFQTDYGVELLTPKPISVSEEQWREALSPDNLLEDLLACMNAAQLARHRFREIARVAGLVFQGYPGAPKSTRQIQASSGLIYDVFAQFDPNNLLLEQARREVMEQQLELKRLRELLARIADMRVVLTEPQRLTPFAFPIWAERVRNQLSGEKWSDRVERMVVQLERAATKEAPSA